MSGAVLKNSVASVLMLFGAAVMSEEWTNSYLKAALQVFSAILLCYSIFSGPKARQKLNSNNHKKDAPDRHKNIGGKMPYFKAGSVLGILGLILSAAYPASIFSVTIVWLSVILLAYSFFTEKNPPKIFSEGEFKRLGQLQLAIMGALGCCFIAALIYMLTSLDILGYITLALAGVAVFVAVCMLTYVIFIFLKASD